MHPFVRARRAGARVPVSAVRAAKAQGARKGGTGLRPPGSHPLRVGEGTPGFLYSVMGEGLVLAGFY